MLLLFRVSFCCQFSLNQGGKVPELGCWHGLNVKVLQAGAVHAGVQCGGRRPTEPCCDPEIGCRQRRIAGVVSCGVVVVGEGR